MENNELIHFDIKGMKWGQRRFETSSGHLTSAGKKRYEDESSNKRTSASKNVAKKESTGKYIAKTMGKGVGAGVGIGTLGLGASAALYTGVIGSHKDVITRTVTNFTNGSIALTTTAALAATPIVIAGAKSVKRMIDNHKNKQL